MREIVDLRDVLYFTRVVQHGGFTHAARALAVPVATVSRRVAALEESLGVRLLHRTTRSLSPTDAGAAYYERALRAVDDLLDATDAVVSQEAELTGALAISAPTEIGTTFLAEAVREFMSAHPALRVRLMLTNRPVDLVTEGIDIAFRLRRERGADSSLIVRDLGPAQLAVVASPAYLADAPPLDHPRDLARHWCLTHGLSSEWTTWMFQGHEPELVRVEVKGRLWCSDFRVLREAALASQGVAMVPAFLVRDDVQQEALVRVPPGFEPPVARLMAVYPTARHLAPKVRRFLDFVAERLDAAPFRPDAGN